jgi:hypothetical protein
MIKFEPDKLLAKIAPKSKIKKLLSRNLTLKKTALSFIDDIDFIDKKQVTETALKVVKAYKKRVKEDPDERAILKKDPAQLIQRVQNQVILQIGTQIKENYSGERYIWLPSDADEPRPEHQLNYGQEFTVGEGDMPGEEFGCRCGMQILVNDSSFNF